MPIGLAFRILALLATSTTPPRDTVVTSIRVDSARHEIVLTSGPWRRASMGHGAVMGMDMAHHVAAATTFSWSVDGWVRSLRFRARTRDGHEVPRSALHHLAMVNLARRDLFYQIPERMFEMGSETADIVLPGSIAIPVNAGMPMALTIAWGADDYDATADVTVELTMDWWPADTRARPITVYPVTMQVMTLAGETSFDLPPGASRRSTLYPVPLAGRILAAGGHLHDLGTEISLRDISLAGSEPVLSLASQHDAAGHVTGIERVLSGAKGAGIPIYAGHRYQFEGRYFNPNVNTVAEGGMAFLVLLIAPERAGNWPQADPEAASWQMFLTRIGIKVASATPAERSL